MNATWLSYNGLDHLCFVLLFSLLAARAYRKLKIWQTLIVVLIIPTVWRVEMGTFFGFPPNINCLFISSHCCSKIPFWRISNVEITDIISIGIGIKLWEQCSLHMQIVIVYSTKSKTLKVAGFAHVKVWLEWELSLIYGT